jgi:hypothetical protein
MIKHPNRRRCPFDMVDDGQVLGLGLGLALRWASMTRTTRSQNQ